MTDKNKMLDLYFLDARARLIDVAAFMDRVDREGSSSDFRYKVFCGALKALESSQPDRAKNVLMAFSDPSDKPTPAATTKAACGAWPGTNND
ncbi:MAG TPA: hypothetical protein QGG93_11050 [Verrucomicrobiota bacterium]|jgi:hypothetical protein|nr:hypothetical protein [Verrucomicrobiota bacterium]